MQKAKSKDLAFFITPINPIVPIIPIDIGA